MKERVTDTRPFRERSDTLRASYRAFSAKTAPEPYATSITVNLRKRVMS